MTYEYAEYFRLLLLCGFKDELQAYIDNALEIQDPVSDIILELSWAVSDDGKTVSLLNEYLLKAKETHYDYSKNVFDMIMSFLKRKYVEESMSRVEITVLMHKISIFTGYNYDEPWMTMYYMEDYFSAAEEGYISKEEYEKTFDAFIIDKVCLSDHAPVHVQPKESFFKKLIKILRGNR